MDLKKVCKECERDLTIYPNFTKSKNEKIIKSDKFVYCFKCREKFKSRKRMMNNREKWNKYHIEYYHNKLSPKRHQ